MRRSLLFFLPVLSLSLLTMCDTEPQVPALQDITLDRTSLEMTVGDVDTLYMGVIPQEAETPVITPVSGNEDVVRAARISATSFRVEAVGTGSATLTFSADEI